MFFSQNLKSFTLLLLLLICCQSYGEGLQWKERQFDQRLTSQINEGANTTQINNSNPDAQKLRLVAGEWLFPFFVLLAIVIPVLIILWKRKRKNE